MINSISLEKDRYEKLMPIIAGTDMKVIALCMSDAGMPQTVDDRMRIADELVGGLLKNNVKVENIFVDPLVQPLSVDGTFGVEFINTIEKIVAAFPGIHTACGLSNISYGLPARKFMNQTFMTMAIAKGLDGAIINPLDKKHDGQHHRGRGAGRPGQLLHELPQGLSGRHVRGIILPPLVSWTGSDVIAGPVPLLVNGPALLCLDLHASQRRFLFCRFKIRVPIVAKYAKILC
jgi:hypothetical protein